MQLSQPLPSKIVSGQTKLPLLIVELQDVYNQTAFLGNTKIFIKIGDRNIGNVGE
jgi:hypothetical protein